MEDDSDILAFRRFIANVAGRLTEEDIRKIIYIRLYRQREALSRGTDALDVLAALEHADIFSPSQPDGLLDIFEKDLKNRQLANQVKGFIRDRKRKSRIPATDIQLDNNAEIESEIDSRLRMCYKMAISQTNVLLKHLDALRVATVLGKKVDEQAARMALVNVSEVATALAKLREKADVELKEAWKSNALEENYEDVVYHQKEEETVMVKHLPRVPVSLPQSPQIQQKPLTAQLKPLLKSKPKLNNPSKRPVTKGETLPSKSDASRASSLPDLLEDTTINDDEDEEDYIYPELVQEEITKLPDGGDSSKHSRISKTISLPHLQPHQEVDTTIFFRPLPQLPGIKNKQKQTEPQQEEYCYEPMDGDEGKGRNIYASLDSTEDDNEPVYDDINVNTLLSRMGEPRNSSSDSD